ncbi:hypothetical protein A3Q56_00991 [Intoshia linei]|uniref:Receptor expression-enhancing protein n=1 Tax=Intoshia linei TaxID=1819745 RepID=A0A177BC59_9BILA|nr:hypothetical protein A3Q56_00991 [Intoshia linei]
MISCFLSRIFILIFGVAYPLYASYKTIKTKNVKLHVSWMMYWIVFSIFHIIEFVTDIFFSWLPLYYEIKIIFLLWLLSGTTRGSSILYKKFIHPWFVQKENDIDSYIEKAKSYGYTIFMTYASQIINHVTTNAFSTFKNLSIFQNDETQLIQIETDENENMSIQDTIDADEDYEHLQEYNDSDLEEDNEQTEAIDTTNSIKYRLRKRNN